MEGDAYYLSGEAMFTQPYNTRAHFMLDRLEARTQQEELLVGFAPASLLGEIPPSPSERPPDHHTAISSNFPRSKPL